MVIITRASLTLLSVIAVVSVLLACAKPQNDLVQTFAGSTMGTTYSIKTAPAENVDATELFELQAELKGEVDSYLVKIEAQMSTYQTDSELSKFNLAPSNEWFSLSDELFYLIEISLDYSSESNGAFDISVGPLVNLWGFGPLVKASVKPEAGDIEGILKGEVGYQALKIDPQQKRVLKEKDLYLDLSAIAKGHAVDGVALLIEEKGISNYLVEIGGEMRASGTKPNQQAWRIAIESPFDEQRSIQKIIKLNDIGVATSGDYRNFIVVDGKRYSHTIDPSTGYPVTHSLASVTVLHSSAMRADALATMLLVMGPERALRYSEEKGLAVFLIMRDEAGEFAERYTESFKPYFFDQNGL